MFNTDYSKFYNLFKKLPGILAITTISLTFIWSIVDVSVFSREDYWYGIMQLESAFLVLIIWWAIGAVSALLNWFISALVISPTVQRTDAIINKGNL